MTLSVMVVTATRAFQTPAPVLLCSLVSEVQAAGLLMMWGVKPAGVVDIEQMPLASQQ